MSAKPADVFWLLFALAGFAVAEPLFELFRQSPEFLVARQNTVGDVWALVLGLSLVLPASLWLPAGLGGRRFPRTSKVYAWAVCALLAACFAAQVLQGRGLPAVPFAALAAVAGAVASWWLLFTRWSLLARVLALVALLFPVRFIAASGVLDEVRGRPGSTFTLTEVVEDAPDIVFVVLDELPVFTLLDNDQQIDGRMFPGFARLAEISDWYYDATSVSDVTVDAVPSILTGLLPAEQQVQPTMAELPANLFSMLRAQYEFNVAETVTRLCPRDKCRLAGPSGPSRLHALALDLAAVYLHRITPAAWATALPNVTTNFSGFFADRQVFFPAGWLENAGAQTGIDRPGFLQGFIDSIEPGGTLPMLNFVHVLFPHEPLAYFPNGDHYGLEWLRGMIDGVWQDHAWGLVSAKQRYYLQLQYTDRLVGRLLERLEDQGMLDEVLLVLVADHGGSFRAGDNRRILVGDNAATILRVPLFIKRAGQASGRRIDGPVMTIDILPTMLASMGVDVGALGLDGVDLAAHGAPENRPRVARSSALAALREIGDDEADVGGLTAEARRQLHLDDPDRSLWDIGPLGSSRGRNLTEVCEPVPSRIRFRYHKPRVLKQADPARMVPAYIGGAIAGRDAPAVSLPFVVSSNGRIAASGHTWERLGKWQFFALVDPALVRQPGWLPEIALLREGKCLMGNDLRWEGALGEQ